MNKCTIILTWISTAGLALGGCAPENNNFYQIPLAASGICAEMGFPQGSKNYPGCYRAATETVLAYPDSSPEDALNEARDKCGAHSGKGHAQCVVDAFSAVLRSQQKSSENDRNERIVTSVLRSLASGGNSYSPPATPQDGHVVYDTSECIGAVVMNKCHGSILPNAAYHPTCHGEMLNGQCTGPMF